MTLTGGICKLHPSFEKLVFLCSLSVTQNWSDISKEKLEMFLDHDAASISHDELIRLFRQHDLHLRAEGLHEVKDKVGQTRSASNHVLILFPASNSTRI